jgi:hypothetical protein
MDRTSPYTLEATRPALEALTARLNILRAAADLRVGDAERVAFHARKEAERRRLGRTRNNLLFAHGSNAEVGGYVDVDDLAICGLEANGDLYGKWVAEAACALPGSSRASLLCWIFDQPERLAWCRAEGARVRWHFAKDAYWAEVLAWRAKAKSRDQQAEWRKRPPTARQLYMIELICARFPIAIERPPPMRRGKAHNWISMRGGDPKFWSASAPPLERRKPR